MQRPVLRALWIMNATILALNLPVVSPGVREHISVFPPFFLSLPPCLSPAVEEYSHKLLIINWPVWEGSERFITLLWVSVRVIYCSISAESDLGWVQEYGSSAGLQTRWANDQNLSNISIFRVPAQVHDAHLSAG